MDISYCYMIINTIAFLLYIRPIQCAPTSRDHRQERAFFERPCAVIFMADPPSRQRCLTREELGSLTTRGLLCYLISSFPATAPSTAPSVRDPRRKAAAWTPPLRMAEGRQHGIYRRSRKTARLLLLPYIYLPVALSGQARTASGVPVATTRPPLSPPPGPMSTM